jgi:hypothetical protein
VANRTSETLENLKRHRYAHCLKEEMVIVAALSAKTGNLPEG